MFISGATASPLYHHHPHHDDEHVHPHGIEQQTRNAMEAIKSILDEAGATWRDVVKVTKYLTDFREADAMHKTMQAYFGDWRPASTTVCINQLSSPGAPRAPNYSRRGGQKKKPPALCARGGPLARSLGRLRPPPRQGPARLRSSR